MIQRSKRPVVVGVIDDGFEPEHAMLRGAIDLSLSMDHVDGDKTSLLEPASFHGQLVVGVIVGTGEGLAPAAPAATIAAHRVSFGAGATYAQFVNALKAQAATADVANCSWGFVASFADAWSNPTFRGFGEALQGNASNGRDGLGTTMVWAAGNSRMAGLNTNGSMLTANEFGVVVGALDREGRAAPFSTPGATVLVSALGVDVLSTDRTGSAGRSAGDTAVVSGTSFAAPAVSGVVHDLYAANPMLGYRDVAEILALSAAPTETASAEWQTTGATFWNGGGLRYSHRHGFGRVDAEAAVRLAESWTDQQTYSNRETVKVATPAMAIRIPDNGRDKAFATVSFDVVEDIDIERVSIDLDISHWMRGDLRILLVSPGGTTSILADRPGKDLDNSWDGGDFSLSGLKWTFGSVAHLGESTVGRWTIVVQDWEFLFGGTIRSAGLTFVGTKATADDTLYFTDAFSGSASGHRIHDPTGITRLNMAAVSERVDVDLSARTAMISGVATTISAETRVGRVDGGGGGDRLRGDWRANELHGGRGNDTLWGGGGDDVLAGGQGRDAISGGSGRDIAIFDGTFDSFSFRLLDRTLLRFTATDVVTRDRDTVWDVETLQFDDRTLQTVTLFDGFGFV